MPDFQVTKGIHFDWAAPLPDTLVPGQALSLQLVVSRLAHAGEHSLLPTNAQANEALSLDQGLTQQLYLIYQYSDVRKEEWRYQALTPLLTRRLLAGRLGQPIFEGSLKLDPDLPPGAVKLHLGLGYTGLPPLRGQSATAQAVIIRPEPQPRAPTGG
ncbi:MAG: hypothetical protein HC821_02160 [Lewinella sp.]|nr:hypothetical protein [Lewinella sp.]